MKSSLERVVLNRDLTPEEYLSVSFFMMSVMMRPGESDSYYYVKVNDDMSLNVTSYDPKEVLWQAKELMCTDLQALYAIVEYEGFYEQLLEELWSRGIGDYNRYIAQTDKSLVDQDETRYCFAKKEADAYFYFDKILHLENILTIREDNEEIY